jgi:hypothetical protein
MRVKLKQCPRREGFLISRRLEYQLQLGSCSLKKSPTEVGTLNLAQ